jgi:hypothetical protein
MKRAAYILLFGLLLSSCGPSHPLNYARIEFIDSSKDNFLVFSVFDSSLQAKKYESENDSILTFSFQKIHRIFLQGDPNTAEWIGFLGGTVAGVGCYYLVTTPTQRHYEDGTGGILLEPLMFAGLVTGHIIGNKLHEIDLYSPEGKASLRKSAESKKIQ